MKNEVLDNLTYIPQGIDLIAPEVNVHGLLMLMNNNLSGSLVNSSRYIFSIGGSRTYLWCTYRN